MAKVPAAPALTLASLAFVVLAGVAGGASRQNAAPLAALELAALPLAALAIRRFLRGEDQADRASLVLLGFVFAVPLLQLIPLPPPVWTLAPGQRPRVEALTLLGLPMGWRASSLIPRATLGCALALLPAAAMVLAGARLGPAERRAAVGLWIGGALAGLALGAVQLAQSKGGGAYLYAVTNAGSLVGFFANRNHEAALLVSLVPFAAALATGPDRTWRALAAIFALLALVALGVVQSRAGLILAAPAALGALAVLARGPAGRARLAMAVGAAALAAFLVAFFALKPLITRFAPSDEGEYRFEAWPAVVAAAQPFQPLGAGVGAFERVFRAAEPLDLVRPKFLNHAHNDYLELWLETGWLGAGVLGLFLAWFALAARRAWSRAGESVARAASVAILVLLAASVVDYPLRTETLACLFAFACACLARSPRALPGPEDP
jgi:O-antigen ligase